MMVVHQAKKNLIDFAIATDSGYQDTWFHETMAIIFQSVLQKVENGLDARVILTVPPRHGKSELATMKFPAWMLGKHPEWPIMVASYSGELAIDFGQGTREIMQSPAYKEIFDTRLRADTKAKGKWMTKERGGYMAAGAGGAITGKGFKIGIVDDIFKNREEAESKIIRDSRWDWYRSTFYTRQEGNTAIIVIGCLVAGSKVLMENGSRVSIEKIKIGERVLSYDSIETVEAMIPQGISNVYELKTRNNTIQATPNHPFLTKDGFKRLDKLKIGEKIKVLSSHDVSKTKTAFTEDDMWLLGFMLGDGWITEHPNKYGSMRWVVCFARGVHEDTNKKVLKLWQKITKNKIKLTFGGYYRTTSADLAKKLKDLGFEGTSRTKRIPEYVFGLSDNLKEAFFSGFMKADGYINNTLRCLELANFDLVKDLKHLAELSGYKVSNIHTRTRMSQPPNSPKPFLAISHHISIGNKKSDLRWRWSSIVSIKKQGMREVYDLTVSNTHNFVAEGMVVHNTRWHTDDVIGRLITKQKEDEANNEEEFDKWTLIEFPAIATKDEDFRKKGDALWAAKFPINKLRKTENTLGPYEFSALYQCNPITSENQEFKEEWFKERSLVEVEALDTRKFATIDPGGKGIENDKTGIIRNYVDRQNKWNLKAMGVHFDSKELLEHVFKLHDEGFEKIGIEETVYLKAVEPFYKDACIKRNKFPNIVPIKQPTTQKEVRIRGLIPRYSNGGIYHIEKECKDLEDELIVFPRGAHDDVPDALAMQNEVVETPINEQQKAVMRAQRAQRADQVQKSHGF